MTYQDGFEDATELCLSEIKWAKTKTDAQQKVMYLLGLVKEQKFGKIKKMLGAI